MKNFKWTALVLTACGFFAGCSDNGGAPTLSSEDPFDILLSRSNYVYKSRDSLLILKAPVCREVVDGGLKYLEWKKETSKPDSLTAYQKNGRAYLVIDKDEDAVTYMYDGSTFPKGNWVKTSDSDNSIRNALVFTTSEMKETFQYEGACFMKSFYSQLFKGNKSLEGAEEALGKFYLMFSTEKDPKLDEDEMVDNIRIPACDELSMYDGEVSVSLNTLKASSGKITLRYKEQSCLIDFDLRYANNKSDCQAAYDEYKLDRNAEKGFKFKDYDKTVDYSYNCIAGLVQNLRKDNGTMKKTMASDEDAAKELASAAVDVILSGLK